MRKKWKAEDEELQQQQQQGAGKAGHEVRRPVQKHKGPRALRSNDRKWISAGEKQAGIP